ncbi:MAG: thiamine phosphate synthase [Chloroflexota bacterium]|nr:thiamine phosphate synthase [Chloroflexota bacterium]PLS77145.1 MAG: thiamine phosphate synthase [Chloroflexota bacterium]
MDLKLDWRLYVLIDAGILGDRQPLEVARAALAGGATVLQLRAKTWSVREQVAVAQALLPLTRAQGVPLIINDHVDIALALGADGVHLGVDDLPVALARTIMPRGVIGYSPEGIADAARAVGAGVDYLGVGPFAVTGTKLDAGTAIGATGLAQIVQAVQVPVVAVGGLDQHNAADAITAGAAGIVVASAVTRAADPVAAARQLRSIVAEALSCTERA